MRTTSALISLAGLLALAPAAQAATLGTDARCYQETQDVVVTGEGYQAGQIVTVSRDGAAIGSTRADAAGAFRAKFPTRELPGGQREGLYDLAATDGMATAVTRYRLTKVFADFNPGTGNPATLRVRFTVNGFSLLRKQSTVYMHYVRPNGKVRRTVSLGRARGTCGLIRRTARRHLFPFEAEKGRWVLQFDTKRTYERANQSSKFVWVRKPVEVLDKG